MNKHFTNTVLTSILSSFEMQVVFIDQDGVIQMANKAWLDVDLENDHAPIGTNYLVTCQNSIATGDEEAGLALAGIKSVLSGTAARFEMEWQCGFGKIARLGSRCYPIGYRYAWDEWHGIDKNFGKRL